MRPPDTTVKPRAQVIVQMDPLLKQQLVDFAYAEQSTMTAIIIEAAEDFLAKNAHILSERHLRKQEQVEILISEERQRQRAERDHERAQAELETKFDTAPETARQDADAP